ncbi:MAG: glycoside-pentoside-hexuronide (GPH):cation symporter [Clostridia bacterium]|nr:glycoside-pentoside-hexuronide (GPH):cation symporter [Clostridia bacterium]
MKNLNPVQKSYFNRNKWVYSLGGVGRDLAYSLYTYFLLTFILYTKGVTSAQFATISIIMVICRIWDGINDPIMGGIIENTRTKFGKFKPWIFIGAVTNAVVLVLIYTLPLKGTAFVIAFTFLYLIWDITYTMNDIGYWGMLPSLTSEPRERDVITSMSNLFAGLGTILANGLIPILTVGSHAIGNSAVTGYKVVAIVIGLVFIGCQSSVCIGVKEKNVEAAMAEEKIGFKKMVQIVFNNKQVLWTSLILLFVNLSGALLTAFGTNYIYLSYGYEGSFTTIFVVFYGAASGLSFVIYPMLTKKLTRNQIIKMSFAATIIGYICFLLSGTFIKNVNLSFYLLCAESLFIGLGYSLFYLIAAIFLSNTIEYNEYMTGERNEALIFSVRPFMAKLSSSLQQVIIMVVYLAIGLTEITNKISNAENLALQNPDLWTVKYKANYIAEVLSGASSGMTLALRIVMAVLPVIFMGIGYFITMRKYIIDEKKYDEILTELKARHGEEE